MKIELQKIPSKTEGFHNDEKWIPFYAFFFNGLKKLKKCSVLVDLRSRCFAFRGRCGEPPRRLSACGVSPAPYSHRSLRTFCSNQLYLVLYFLRNRQYQRPFKFSRVCKASLSFFFSKFI
jgi:hypothetical protein